MIKAIHTLVLLNLTTLSCPQKSGILFLQLPVPVTVLIPSTITS